VDERVGRMAAFYSGQAAGYDRCWAPALHGVNVALVEALPLGSARRVLEIGTGTGRLIPDLRAAAPGALVVGVDPAIGMLALGGGVRALADGMALPFGDGVFDVALACFILHHLPSPAGGLAEAHRVLRPGGAMGTTTWASVEPFPALERWGKVLDEAGAPASAPWAISQQDLTDTDEKVASLFESAGFRDVRTWRGPYEHEIGRAGFFDRYVRLGASRRRLEALAEAERDRLVEEGRRRLADLPEDAFVERDEVIYAVGVS
jgi:ubiquinone/menaquinone biosynthesis C-methylase UbiE